MRFLHALLRHQRGASAVEYALVAALIALAIVAAIGGVGNDVSGSLGETEQKVREAT
jgi:pilus assembly protein Flp/PilA